MSPQFVVAISAEEEAAIDNGTYFYGGGVSGNCEAPINSNLPEGMPEPYRSAFQAASNKYQVDAFFLAAIHKQEQPRAFEVPEPNPWQESTKAAKGPMQFLEPTWGEVGRGYAEDGDGDGDADIDSVWDAAFGAAHYLQDRGVTAASELGPVEGPYVRGTLLYAAAAYNAGEGRVRGDTKTIDDLPSETRVYVPKVAEYYNAFRSGDSLPNNSQVNTSICGGIGIGGQLTFPLQTTKDIIRGGADGTPGNGDEWCYDATSNCHGSYSAADIHAPEGTPVIAAVGGTVQQAFHASTHDSVRIHGDNGLWYFYQHMTPGSVSLSVGDRIAPGEHIGTVGNRAAAEGTAPHLHFDVSSERTSISRECVSEGRCVRSIELMIDSQPWLAEAFKALPEN